MTRDEKIDWMIHWAYKNRVRLDLEGECGLGRECVGIIAEPVGYPDYEWYDVNSDDYARLDKNGEVWRPEAHYHKHPCVAVLGRGEDAESQLYDWLKWFDDNHYVVEIGSSNKKDLNIVDVVFGKHMYARMVRKEQENTK
jgi:hypothetical protein